MRVTMHTVRGRIVTGRGLIAMALVAGLATSAMAENRTFDGTGNTLGNAGAAGKNLRRDASVGYGDLTWTMARQSVTGARQISNALAKQTGSILNDRQMSDMVWQWGQFLDHDIDLTPEAGTEMALIDTTGDPDFLGTPINFTRSVWDPATGVSPANPRQQRNLITSFIDSSNVYGSDGVRNTALRELSGGRMATSAGNLLPYNTGGLDNAQGAGAASDYFLAGDVRSNEQAGLTSMHTLWVREHNYWADRIASETALGTDEEIFQAARKIVNAEMQAITYNEWLPALTGASLDPYTGHNLAIDPSISNEFSTAAFRIGHSMLSSTLRRMDDSGATIGMGNLALQDAFFNPTNITDTGIEPILKGLASQGAQEIDNKVVDDVRNFLFGPPGAGGFDLASLNIQRGRDHGLADYNTMRVDYGLAPISDFTDITSDTAVSDALASVYANVDEIDPWVGMLAETHVSGSSMGELMQVIILDQFERLRDGDRFFYLNPDDPCDLGGLLSDLGMTVSDLDSTLLSEVLGRNTGFTSFQENVFFIPTPGALGLLAMGGVVAARRKR
ncbi:MAG: peroxiredoxin [Phycisphaeraceae bacterium]|nr:peroxiredoxin [Phycisphaeraceae bacterium]MCB9848857.1 peroxiredoxin [Phycisphaeraceae bacterium]